MPTITQSPADDLRIDCGIEKTLLLKQVVYDDLQIAINNVKLPPSSSPDNTILYDYGVGGGVTYPVLGFDIGEYIYFDIQTSHAMKLNSILDVHFHYTLPNTTTIGDNIKFQLDVISASIGGQWAVPTGSPFTKEFSVVANDDTYHRLVDIADIPAINTTVSTVYKCKLSRISASANDYGSDIYITFIDCHYQKDTLGSRQEYAK
jgi:hypothetical protein